MRTCQCASCGELRDCELVRDTWMCGACIAALSTPPDVTPTTDDGANSAPDSETEPATMAEEA